MAATSQLRCLNETGIERFRAYLQSLREGGTDPPPRDMLTDPRTSLVFEPDKTIEDREFPTRREAARYLNEVLGDVPGVEENVGLWSWLSLFYFDQVCPPRNDGKRKPGRDYRHIPELGYLQGHRHLLGGPFLVYRLHGERARLLLASPLYRENHFHHQLASRQTLISCPAVVEAATLMYYDETRNRPKRGAQDPDRPPGGLLRFVDVLQQLEVNYDLHSMDGQTLLQLLPQEFDRWKPSRGLFGRLFSRA